MLPIMIFILLCAIYFYIWHILELFFCDIVKWLGNYLFLWVLVFNLLDGIREAFSLELILPTPEAINTLLHILPKVLWTIRFFYPGWWELQLFQSHLNSKGFFPSHALVDGGFQRCMCWADLRWRFQKDCLQIFLCILSLLVFCPEYSSLTVHLNSQLHSPAHGPCQVLPGVHFSAQLSGNGL